MTTANTVSDVEERRYSESDLLPILQTLITWRDGDFRRRVPHAPPGILSEIRLLLNEVADRREHLANELHRVRREVVKEGRFGERLTAGPGVGSWAESVDSVNCADRRPGGSGQRRGGRHRRRGQGRPVTPDRPRSQRQRRGAPPRQGDQRHGRPALPVHRRGHPGGREVGTEGRLGGQANVRGMSGTWKDLTEAVNTMASRPHRPGARHRRRSPPRWRSGDLTPKITVDARGEMLELKNTVNTMVDQLSAFADEVTRVAREVGTEGKLGGQAAGARRVRHLEGPHRQRQLAWPAT